MAGCGASRFESDSTDRAAFDERRMAVLVVAQRSVLAAAVRAVLEKAVECDFAVDSEGTLEGASVRVLGRGFDLLILDTAHDGLERRQIVDAAHELATHLPVIALSGTEPYRTSESTELGERLRARLEEADLPTLSLRTRRRARRLGASVLAPVFCRLDHPGA